MANIQAVFTDLDGTLLNQKNAVHPRDISTIAGLKRQGVGVYFATGRHPVFCGPYAKDLGIDIFVGCNGALIWDTVAHKALNVISFSRQELGDICATLDEMGAVYSIQTDKMPYFCKNDTRLTNGGTCLQLRSEGPCFTELGVRQNLQNQLSETVVKIGVLGLTSDQLDYIAENFPQCTLALYYGKGMAEIAPPGADKWNGIKIMSKAMGFSLDKALVIGDSPNDIPMIKGATMSAAPSNATEQVKELVDYVACDSDSGVLTDAIKHFWPQGLGDV